MGDMKIKKRYNRIAPIFMTCWKSMMEKGEMGRWRERLWLWS
ncbi:hypothetical protein [Halocella sp. SP3-1]|nr:hypothetical protein [Halocella sp. SP3-1]